MSNNYHKEKCQSCVRKSCEMKNSTMMVKIIVTGKHAFDWSVTVIKTNSAKTLTFKEGRVPALKEYNKLVQQFKQFGDCIIKI